MSFSAGSVTFRRFAVLGKSPSSVDQDLLDKLAQNALKPSEFGRPDEEEYGWSGGRHLFDALFTFEHNVFADALHFALRIDTNKAPGDVKKAYQIMEEEATAAANPSGFISKQQKKDVKIVVAEKIDEELRAGKYRRSKLLPILWDLPSQTLYCSATGSALEKLQEIFERTFGLALEAMSAGSAALRVLGTAGRRRDYEDSRPTRIVPGPDGESQYPEYPWVLKGPEPKDFLGNEFLLWLWHEADHRGGAVQTAAGEVNIFFDRSLDLDCAYGQSGKDSLRGDGPSHMPEARDALRSGKVPRKAGLTIHGQGQQFEFLFNAETFACGAAKLPEVEDAESPRQVFEERVTMLRDLAHLIDSMFESFLKIRATSSWEAHASAIRKWIFQPMKPIAAVA